MTSEFDEQWYLSRYPDVAAAIAAGTIGSALAHYQRFGAAEKRQPGPTKKDGESARPKHSYQSFPGEVGDSLSEQKFRCLRIPSFKGKAVLDVGCNEGFFCLKAAEGGATRILGLDRNPEFIAAAQARYAQSELAQNVVEFRSQSWDVLPDEQFDIILFLSALHYAVDQEAIIGRLVNRLTPSGVLVLECGVVNEERSEFVKVRRAIDEVEFPTLGKLKQILDVYAWKPFGSSVQQTGDPVPRQVLHIRKLRPTVILLLGNSDSGKTTLARRLRKFGIPCIMIDDHVRIRAQDVGANIDPRLAAVLADCYDGERLDQLYAKIQEQGIVDILFDDIIKSFDQSGAPVLIVEGAVGGDPITRNMVVRKLEESGYFVWLGISGAEL